MLDQQAIKLKEKIILADNYISTSNKEMNERWNNLDRLYSLDDVKKLQGTASGSQMPASGCCMDASVIQLIETWIDEGAQNN